MELEVQIIFFMLNGRIKLVLKCLNVHSKLFGGHFMFSVRFRTFYNEENSIGTMDLYVYTRG